jgi:phenylpropionate dioxygenase-like ring-hydroxylating dioxygenase large terminal subunit
VSDTAARVDGASTSGVAELGLDRAQVEATLVPLERASMLPPPAFTDSSVFAWELEHLFTRGWICVGHVSSVAEPGAYLTREVGSESVLVIGGKDSRPHAFFNVCRHRGARIAEETEGRFRARITCPYHAWSYGFDGGLVGTRHMEGMEDFDPGCYGLRPVEVAVVGGLVLVDLGGAAPPIVDHVGELGALLDRYRNAELERAGARVYEVEANWKAIAENYSECLHCPGVHPELNALSHYASGEEIAGEGLWCGGSMILTEGAETMGREGGSGGGRPAISGLSDADRNVVLYFVLFPNALISLHPDYVMLHTLWPRDTGRTEVTCEWFFEPETVAAPGFDPNDAIDFWDQVNREDWHVCELAQKGVRSRGYTAGRYSNQESDVHAFDVMVAERYMEAL